MCFAWETRCCTDGDDIIFPKHVPDYIGWSVQWKSTSQERDHTRHQLAEIQHATLMEGDEEDRFCGLPNWWPLANCSELNVTKIAPGIRHFFVHISSVSIRSNNLNVTPQELKPRGQIHWDHVAIHPHDAKRLGCPISSLAFYFFLSVHVATS